MSYALTQLRNLLAPKQQSKTGIVVGTKTGEVTIATRQGAVLAKPIGVIAIGDKVALDDKGNAIRVAPIKIIVQG